MSGCQSHRATAQPQAGAYLSPAQSSQGVFSKMILSDRPANCISVSLWNRSPKSTIRNQSFLNSKPVITGGAPAGSAVISPCVMVPTKVQALDRKNSPSPRSRKSGCATASTARTRHFAMAVTRRSDWHLQGPLHQGLRQKNQSRNAAAGSMRAANQAGRKPATMQSRTDVVQVSTTSHGWRCAGMEERKTPSTA